MVAVASGADAGAGAPAPVRAPGHARAGLERLNALSAPEAAAALAACCASHRWAAAIAAVRPYADAAQLYRIAAVEVARLDWPDVLEALTAHPRIGTRAADRASPAAAWSRAEQAAADGPDARTARQLAEANAAYEAAFGHVFLIRATGRTAEQMLDAALGRLRNDPSTEQAVVRDELNQIVRLRLDKLLLGLAEGTWP
ncbi:2-oxo-4-hydroxy-4-carboxy-5-ureidoimidazoline decarboxylase [Actinocrinis puniceicyclus]|uniref:2-oxo-4-hydroxy-4-carboxy-5-ureidoimidazoline decarboxylase n=1 Tax=Actinocrinis puniceicyclus TaxID=977794 RepID=A0A8J8BEA2_9ACTN|nr:2-oxo-4-hydroxy-4-carboxy-5-ureidoimidazoline decarboxylase [Actinocrinis puniceicyclus]MBS2965001.1 2-oxo-4-hydroxy-4-carboxy-5-ureidoimidazoline decarboxylase [Actinocrinis puniceicyclus]